MDKGVKGTPHPAYILQIVLHLAVEVLLVLLFIKILQAEVSIRTLEAARLPKIVFFTLSTTTTPRLIAILQEEEAGILVAVAAVVAAVAPSVRPQSLHRLLRIQEEPLTYLSLKDK